MKVEGDTWQTVEGGASDHVTRPRVRRIIPVKSKHGNWAFDNDDVKEYVKPRALQGWYNVDKIDAGQWMA
jgi:hypothetical protein